MNIESAVQLRYRLQRNEFGLDVSLDIPTRGITGVYGVSGAGKTTLLRCIAGLETPAAGQLMVAGECWENGSTGVCWPAHAREIGYVFQEPRLFAHLDVRRNIEYGARRSKRADGPAFDSVVGLLGLQTLLHRKPDQLSGGEAQRVAIARALLRAPRLVLMDEPLASLDTARKDEILPFLDRLHAESEIPIVYVSHNIGEICRLCDCLVVMHDGRILADGDLQSVLVSMELPQLSGKDAGAVIECTVSGYDADDGLTCLQFSGGTLWVPGEHGETSACLRLRIRASDVSLCRDQPTRTSILNVLPVVIDEMQKASGASLLIRLRAGADYLLARITRRSVQELDLHVGEQVFAQIKSVAVRAHLPN